MRGKKLIPFIVIGALALAAVFGVFTYRQVFAQAGTPTPGAPGQPGAKGWGSRGFKGGGYTQQDLATALGVSLDKLQSAYQTANTEALKQAVSKGLITQAQADQITARGLNQGPVAMFGKLSNSGIDYNSLLAQALGINTTQLQAGYQKAFTTAVDNAVKAGTLTQAQADMIKGREALANNSTFQNSLKSAFTAAVNQAVKDGVITQAQADAILQNQANRPSGGFFGGGFGPGFGGGRGHGFGRGHGRFNGNGTNNNPNAPTVTPQGGI